MAPKSGLPITSGVNEMAKEPSTKEFDPLEIIWRNVFLYIFLHSAALYGIYIGLFIKMQTTIFTFVIGIISGLGITAGAHRLWAHQSYKAKLPLRIFLAFANTIAFQKDIHNWSRDHRVHHKFSETNADPHNAKRGFFFAHIGWLVCKKHPEVLKKGDTIDFSDLLADPVVKFQIRFYYPLAVLLNFVLPTVIPMYFWGETFTNAFFVTAILRYVYSLHQSFLVNSAAHMWGQRPYDATINPADNNLIAITAMGEGFHNYHHTFPFDYSTSEYGIKWNITTAFINIMALIGQAYDLKSAPRDIIKARKRRTGIERQSNQKVEKQL